MLGDMRPITREAERKAWKYAIEEKNEEIKRLIEVNKARQALNKAQGKKIAQLLKEKEWLVEKYCQDMAKKGWIDKHRHEVIITREMQQALKEG